MADDDERRAHSRSGRQLYELLPSIYRTRDGSDRAGAYDLARYLDAFGEVLDAFRALLDQQLADAFPDDDATPRIDARAPVAQDWVLPYLGALVDARPVSIDPRGQRAEVASAVRWRQRKGTKKAAEELTEEVAQVSAVLQEGWQRVAVTARVDGRPSRPVTVDTRTIGRAEISRIDEPEADFTRFEGIERPWRVVDAHGVPVTDHGYQDASLRTVDTRAPSSDRRRGLYHPRRLLAWVAPEDTLRPLPPLSLPWADFIVVDPNGCLRLDTGDARAFVCSYRGDVEIAIPEGTTLVLDDDAPYYLEGLRFGGKVVVTKAAVVARQCHFQSLELRGGTLGDPVLDASGCLFTEIVASTGRVVLDACTVRGPLVCLELHAQACIFTGLMAGASDGSTPIEVVEGLAGCWTTAQGPVRFMVDEPTDPAGAVLHPDSPRAVTCGSEGRELGRYRDGRPYPVMVVTEGDLDLSTSLAEPRPDEPPYQLCDLVLCDSTRVDEGALWLRRVAMRTLSVSGDDTVIHASGCIFDALAFDERPTIELEYCTVMALTGESLLRTSDCIIVSADASPGEDGCLRWSSLPSSWPLQDHERCVHGVPCFLSTRFEERLYGLLSPASSASIRSGAEDGGELGAYHDTYWLHRLAGVEEKLLDHIPIGITPVLVPDPTLITAPPRLPAGAPKTEP